MAKRFPVHCELDDLKKVPNPRSVGVVTGLIIEDFVPRLITHFVDNRGENNNLKVPVMWECDWSSVDEAGFFRNMPCVQRVRESFRAYQEELERVNKINKERKKNSLNTKNGNNLAVSALEPEPEKPKVSTDPSEMAMITKLRNLIKDKIINTTLSRYTTDDGKRLVKISSNLVDMISLVCVEFIKRFRDGVTRLSDHCKRKLIRDSTLVFLVEMQYNMNGVPVNQELMNHINSGLESLKKSTTETTA